MLLTNTHPVFNTIATAYLIGFPVWIVLANKVSKKYHTASLIASVVMFIVVVAIYIFSITYTHPVHGEYAQKWKIGFVMIFESVCISLTLLIGSLKAMPVTDEQ